MQQSKLKMASEKLPWGMKSKGIAPGSMKVYSLYSRSVV